MTALVTADLHLSDKVRDQYRFKAMSTIAGLVDKHNVDTLVVLGDLTENKDYHPATLVNDVVDIFFSLTEFCDVIALKGNHDYTQADCPFFRFLRRLEHVRWINDVMRLDLSAGLCLFLPHTRNYEKDWSKLPHLEEIDWVFAHNTFEGAKSEHGKSLHGIPVGFFETLHGKVISGDIHTPQTLGQVTYVGAPYTVDFGDDYEPRVLLLDNKGNMRSLPLPGPQKRLIELRAGYDPRKINAAPGDIVQVRYTLKPDEQDKWLVIRGELKRDMEERGFIVHVVKPVTTLKNRSVSVHRPDRKSDERIVQEYAKQLKLSEQTAKVGINLLGEA